MDNLESQVMPAPPNLFAALRAGFDATANKIVIITIPIILDLFLWLGPHLQVKSLMSNYINTLISTSGTTVQNGDVISSLSDSLNALAGRFNLVSLLRSFPVGIPSLMATRSPIQIPVGIVKIADLSNPIAVLLFGLLFICTGLVIGCFYYILVAQASLKTKIDIPKILKNWTWATIQVFSLAIALVILFIAISIPTSCVITIGALLGIPIEQFALFVYLGIILWLAFPLVFSAHGIFVNHNNALVSVKRSMVMTRMTLPTTSLFLLCIFAISAGLDKLWRVPPENSWLTLVGVGGHAFITSALLAASFIYYRDADTWTQGTIKLMKSKRGVI
jgi:hypothetical protein